MNNNSKCCNAPVKIGGTTTQYYICSECGEACDLGYTDRQSQDCYNLHCLSEGENDNVICTKGYKISLTLKRALEGKLDATCKDCPDFED